MKIAVVGATGLVGNEILKVLEERNFPMDELLPVASEMSCGKFVAFRGKQIGVVNVMQGIDSQPDIAIFSAGSQVSLKYAPEFAKQGTFVIDNSSAWRMEKNVPLVVPEVNGHLLKKEQKIISNPNCSTIQLVVALAPLYRIYGIKRIVVSTYQSVTGSGMKGVRQLKNEREGKECEKCYPYPIDLNVIPQGGDFCGNGYTTEEMKLINETRKILNDDDLQVTCTVVRVPVTGGHSESVNVELNKEFDLDEVKKSIGEFPGIILQDDISKNLYPMPLYARGRDEVFVGRIRRDDSQPNSLNLWIVSDNLRKGAATNAVQIAEMLLNRHLI